jgi:hypothetical protein
MNLEWRQRWWHTASRAVAWCYSGNVAFCSSSSTSGTWLRPATPPVVVERRVSAPPPLVRGGWRGSAPSSPSPSGVGPVVAACGDAGSGGGEAEPAQLPLLSPAELRRSGNGGTWEGWIPRRLPLLSLRMMRIRLRLNGGGCTPAVDPANSGGDGVWMG